MRMSSAVFRRITSGRGVALASALCIAAGLGFGTARGPVLGLSIAPAFAFDGTTTPNTAALTPNDGLRNTSHPLLDEKAKALTALQYAAEQGQPAAQWKLGRMYADGDGVPQDQMRAFNYFSEIANTHPDESPGTAQARFVANAFVSLGHYYLNGIPNSKIKANAARARELYTYAATYFGDADAQYELGRLYLELDAERSARSGALVPACRQQRPVPCRGNARRYFVPGPICAAPSRARPDVAHAQQGLRRSRRKLGQADLRQRLPSRQR